ncbi:MAG: pyridoxal 5'-phosphate synthase glutaminase subunit PdxT [Chloroflexi bacterium]|nr:pyridoxal 5'-phosphate synthase glutaminase subunit PdxT [Chloroflexota bacterium]
MLDTLEVNSKEIRSKNPFKNIDGLIIPGGESTSIMRLIEIFDLKSEIISCAKKGMPIWGTCAGMIIVAQNIIHNESQDKVRKYDPLNLIDIDVNRNAFGRQIDSFEHDIDVEGLNDPYHSIFIRAPQVSRVGKNVEILASIKKTKPVILKQDNILVSSFHPELTNDNRIHNLFMQMVLRR